jgi:excisionase family DNA binding protein
MIEKQATLFTVQEVSQLLKLSVLTIYKYIKEQRIEAVEFGGHYRIEKDSLDQFIERHRVKRRK